MMDNNSIVGAILFIVESLVRQVPWRVDAADETPQAKEQAEWVTGALADMGHTFEDFISEAFSFIGYGWSYFEVVYKLRKGESQDKTTSSVYSDGKFGWRKIEIRGQETLWEWLFDEEGGLAGMVQLDPWTGKGPVTIPLEKALLFRTKSAKNNPEGRSLLRPSVADYHKLVRIQEIEAIGIERDLAGMPIFEVPKELLMVDAPPEDRALRQLLETMVQQVRVDERFGGLVPSEMNPDGQPSGFKFKLLSTGGRRMIDTNEIVKRYESRIAMTFLAEFIMIGTEKVGTQSLFQGKSNLFGIALGTLLDIVASTFNLFAIPPIMKLNGVPRALWPKLTHGDVVSPELDKIGSFLESMATAGILSPNRSLENKLLEMADLPVPETEDLEVFDDPSTPTPATAADLASGLLSDRQVEAVLRINEALATGKLARDAAAELLAVTLGMSAKEAERFLGGTAPAAPPDGNPGA
jgi:hypothetical protein